MAMKLTKEVILNEIWKDIVKGVNKIEIHEKLDNDKYSLPTAEMCKANKFKYIAEAYDKCKAELDGEQMGMRATIFNRYLSIYQDAVRNNDRQSAIRSLDSITKLMGLNEADKIDITSNNKLEVSIKFGVSTESTKNNDDEEEINKE